MLTKKRRVRAFVYGILVVMIFVMFFVISEQSRAKTIVSNSNTDSSTLAAALSKQTNLGTQILPSDSEKVRSLNKKLTKNNFIGAYVGTKNNELAFSHSFGSINTSNSNNFRLDSRLYVGNFQDIIDTRILLTLYNHNKIALNDKVEKILPGFNADKKLTFYGLIVSDFTVYVNKKNLSPTVSSFSVIKKDSSIQGNRILREMVMEKITGKRYGQIVNYLMGSKIDLTSTSNDRDQLANNLVGYYYGEKNGIPTQRKAISETTTAETKNRLRMSVADILKAGRYIFSESNYESNLSYRMFQSFLNHDKNVKVENGVTRLLTSSYGQNLIFQTSKKTDKMILVISNFPNRKIRNKALVDKLSTILDVK